jgi:hypothetical protein
MRVWDSENTEPKIQIAGIFPFLEIDSLVSAAKQAGSAAGAEAFGQLVSRFWVSTEPQSASSSGDQVRKGVGRAAKRLLWHFWWLFENGDSARPGEFDGLQKLVRRERILDLSFKSLTLRTLYEARELACPRHSDLLVGCTSRIGIACIERALKAARKRPEYETIEIAISPGETSREQVLKFDGVRVYRNDLIQVLSSSPPARVIPPGEAAELDGVNPPLATNIWFFEMGEEGLHGIREPGEQGNAFVVHQDIDEQTRKSRFHLTWATGIALPNSEKLSQIRAAGVPQ